MLSIRNKATEVFSKKYKTNLKKWVFKRKDKYCINIFLKQFIENNIEPILSGEKEQLLILDSQLKSNINYADFENEVRNIFD